MKTILMVLFLTLPTVFFAQDEATPKAKNAIGINLTYGGFNGLGAEFLYDRTLGKGFYLRGAIATKAATIFEDGNNLFQFKLGLHKTLIDHKYFDIDIGFNLSYNKYDYSNLGIGKGNYLGYEVPIQLKYHLNSSLDLNIGASFSDTPNATYPQSNDIKMNLNLGIYKRF